MTIRSASLTRLLYVGLLVFIPGLALAGPNEGGTLILHANPSIVFTDDIQNYSGMSALDSCSAAVTSVAWESEKRIVFHVLAAFPPGSSPRLKGLAFGIDFDSTKFILAARGKCADFEIPGARWPAPGTGTTESWTTGTQTGLLVEAYWFVGYAYSGQTTDSTSVALIPHPLQNGVFVDDGFPSEADTIAAYGKLGFGMAGALPCPDGGGDVVWMPEGDSGSEEEQGDDAEPPGDEGGSPDWPSVSGDLTFVELEATSAAGYADAYRGLRNDYGLLIQLGMIPDALICRTDQWQRNALLLDARVSRVTLQVIFDAPPDLLPGVPRFAESVWNAMHVAVTPDTFRSFGPEDTGVLIEFADSLRSTPVAQTTTYLMGDVGVSLLYMESDSTGPGACEDQFGEPILIEDWTSDELALGTARIAQGFMRLVSLAPAGANLAFTIQDTVLSTTVEPIQVGISNPKWLNDAMDGLGVSSDPSYLNRMWSLNNRCRAQFGWDWWFTAYVARDVCDPNHNFPPGELACGGAFSAPGPGIWLAYLCGAGGGPETPDNLLVLPPHETGHAFGAVDEYDQNDRGACPDTTNCHRIYGYLREANGNCVNCPDKPEEVSCLMRGMPYDFTICPFTRAHLGWRDSDGDGICDPIDHPNSEMSMMVGEGDSIAVGDWVDIYHGSTWVRRLAASDWNTDQGRMLWDGIDWQGNDLTPGDDYQWRWRDAFSLHSDSLVSDTLAPMIADLMITPSREGHYEDTLSFRFTDADTRSGRVRAIATAEFPGQPTRWIHADRYFLQTPDSVPPITKVFGLPHDGLWTVSLDVWDVGDGRLGEGNAASVDSSYWHGSLAGVGDHRIYIPDFALSRGRPNPSSSWVAWDLRRPSGGKVNLRVVGVDGRCVKSWSEKTLPAGPTRILWDGRDGQGLRVASGRYFLVVTDEAGNTRSNAATVVR